MMGLEEHLLTMFRGDFEFHDEAAPSHLGTASTKRAESPTPSVEAAPATIPSTNPPLPIAWAPDAEKELNKVPFFVRGKARRNTERFAQERGFAMITVETLYDAKSHFGR
jgi:light-independent protochlorophyllide reductase subunit B